LKSMGMISFIVLRAMTPLRCCSAAETHVQVT